MERAQAAAEAIEDLVSQRIRGPVTARPFDGGELISVGGRVVLVLTPPDVDSLSGESLDAASARAVARLQQALAEADEARTPGMIAAVRSDRRGRSLCCARGAMVDRPSAADHRGQVRRRRREDRRQVEDCRSRNAARTAPGRLRAGAGHGRQSHARSGGRLLGPDLRAAAVPVHAAVGRVAARVSGAYR